MIRQDGNGNQNNRSYSRIPLVSDVLDMFGGGGQPEMQTTTQQNLPSWAIPDAMSTLAMGNYYTQNPDYRPSTLDRDYSGIRGYNAQGQPNSQVGQFGLNPMPVQPMPEPGAGITGNLFGGRMFGGVSGRPVQNQPMPVSVPDDRINLRERPGGRTAIRADAGGGTAIANDSIFQGGADTFNFKSGVQALTSQGGGGTARDSSEAPGAWDWLDVHNAHLGKGKLSVADGYTPNEVIEAQNETEDSNESFDPSQITPFQAYDRQRFAAPSDRTLQGENLLANRVNGPNPFAEAQAAARGASNYRSQFSPAALNLTGPRANSYSNVNQGLLAEQYGNANQGLTPAQNYSRAFQENLAQFQDPYTSQVVDQTIQDLDRARRITNNDISGNAARAGAFGGSREALMRTENNRNFADRTAAAVGQLRSQGFQQAADRAQQEQLQRLGLTASDVQNLRGYQSAGNLQGQNISAQDVRDVRGLTSQGALTAQGLGAQSDRDAMGFQNQLQMQGNQLGVEQARLAEQFRQGAGALNLQGAGALGNLAQMQTADERQRIADILAAGGAGDARNQQDLDFIYNEFNRELDYPGRQIDLRNAAISPATGSIVTTTQPRYQQNPILGGAGAALAAYGMTSNPWIAGGAGLLSLLG